MPKNDTKKRGVPMRPALPMKDQSYLPRKHK